jgi:phosphoribosyl 1,2-cyclic phosphate phosphodiesterase
VSLKLTLLGTGTSQGVPEPVCKCPVCCSDHPRNKRLRSSAWLHDEKRSILIDCSADFRQQALRSDIRRLNAIIITHTHHDHIGGLDDVRAFNASSGRISVYILGSEAERLQRAYYYIFEPLEQRGGGIPDIDLIPISAYDEFEVAHVRITPLLAFHGTLPIVGYRFLNTAYLTDIKTLPDETVDQLKGIDHLVISALRYRPHSTHMNIDEALAMIERIVPKKAYLTHTTHDLDYETVNAELPEGVELAYDGLEIEVGRA